MDTSGDLILVGEPSADGGSKDEGRVYVFDPEGNLLETLSAPEPTQGADFGNLVVVRGEIIAVMRARVLWTAMSHWRLLSLSRRNP